MNGQECQYITAQKDFQSVKEVPGFVPKEGSRVGQYLHFGDKTEWTQDFYKVFHSGHDSKDINLVIEVNESWIDGIDLDADNKSERSQRNFLSKFNPQERKNGERLSAWASMKATNSDGTLKYGTFDLNLFKPPINL